MMGTQPSGGDILEAEPRLWVQNLKPRQVLDQVVRDQLKLELLARRVLVVTCLCSFKEQTRAK